MPVNPLKWASQFNLICNTTQILSTVGRNVLCTRVAHRVGGGDLTHIKLIFETAVLASGSTGNTAGIGNEITVNSAVIEYNGVAYQCTFDGGNTSKTVPNWQLDVGTDEIDIQAVFGVPVLPYNAQFFTKHQLTVPDTGTSRIPIASRNSETITPQFLNVNPSVTTMSSPTAPGAWTSTGTAPTSNTFGYVPLVVGRHTSKNAVSFVLHGDSISAGSGDTGKTQTGYGWCGRILGNMPVIPGFLNLAVPSSNLLAGNVDPRLSPYYGYANVGISASATNDFTSSGTAQTVATVLSRQAIIRGRMKNQGVRKVGVMCTLAITSSTDAWTTTANQTVNAGWSAGGRPVTYNDTIKANASTYDFVVPQDALRDATDPFKWEVVGGAKTGDGVHPNQPGYIELAAENQSLIETQIALALTPVAYTSAASGDWNNTATWSPAGVPTELDTATIAAGHTITVPAAFIAKHGGLTMSGTSVSASVLTIAGEVECHGNITRTEFSTITGAVDLNGYTNSEIGAPSAISLSLNKDPITKVLRSDYAQIPSQYQLSSGRYSPARKPLTLLYPRPDGETAADEFHRIAQTGQPVSIKIKCAFGAYPYAAQIVSAPAGSSIGEWLSADSYGDLSPSASYLKITIPALSAGNYVVSVRVFDQQGASVIANWTLNVGNNYYYCSPTAQGLGDGSSRENAASWAAAYGANDAAVSPALGKVLELARGQYTFTSSVDLNSNKPRSIVNQDGSQPEFISSADGARFALKRDGQHLRGIRIRAVTNGPAIETVGYFSRQSIDQIEFFGCSGNPSAANNEAGWFIWSTNNANKRPYFWADEITYTNCNEIAGFDWYSVGPCVVDRLTWNTNLFMLMEPIAFPKASCDIHIRHLTFDNTAIDFDSNGSVLLIGNNEQYAPASCQVSFCFVRTKQDANLNSVIYNASINASSLENWDDHNTYIGGKVTAKNYDADDMVNFNSTVIVNVLGGVGTPEGGGATITNCLTGTSGIVDANGRITNINRGVIGHQIFAG